MGLTVHQKYVKNKTEYVHSTIYYKNYLSVFSTFKLAPETG